MQQLKGGYVVINKDMRTANACGQHQGAVLSGTMRYCIASTAACWDLSPH